MTDAQETMAAVAEKHRPYGLDCKCGRPINSDQDWAKHLAAEVDKALGGLTQQWGVAYGDWGDPDEAFDNETEARAEAQTRCLSCDSCRNAFPKRVMSGWVSGWTVTK